MANETVTMVADDMNGDASCRSGASRAMRTVLGVLLAILIGGQAFWVYCHVVGASPGLSPSPVGAVSPPIPTVKAATPVPGEVAIPAPTATGAGSPLPASSPLPVGVIVASPVASSPSATSLAAPSPVASTGPLVRPTSGAVAAAPPQDPRVETSDLCLALAGADGHLKFDLDARRPDLGKALDQLARAEAMRCAAVQQMQATFSDEQARKVAELIRAPEYAGLTGVDLLDAVQKTMTKVASGATPPPTTGAPTAIAATFDWDQALRGALALEKTPLMLSSSQAAQILAALPDLDAATRTAKLWQSQLNAIFTAQERQAIYQARSTLRARRDAVAARSRGTSQLSRLLQAATATVQGRGE